MPSDDGLHGFRGGTGHVRILDAQHEFAPVAAGVGPRRRGRCGRRRCADNRWGWGRNGYGSWWVSGVEQKKAIVMDAMDAGPGSGRSGGEKMFFSKTFDHPKLLWSNAHLFDAPGG